MRSDGELGDLIDAVVADTISQKHPGTTIEPEAEEALCARVTQHAPLLAPERIRAVARAVRSRLYGLGPIDELLCDVAVTEVMINGPGPVWIERHGVLVEMPIVLDTDEIEVLIERIVAPLGLRADRLAPMVDARLSDGARVNAVLRPLAIDGPYVTIRRFQPLPFSLEDFAEPWAVGLLRHAVTSRRNLVVSGGTGAGKTSLLNALTAMISPGERVITIEDAAELRVSGTHVVRLEARPGNSEGRGEVTIRALVRNALRMRPDRIIVGEVRGAEALDMLQAMSTGHDGSLSTCHANTPTDALRRLETMVLMAGLDLPLEAVRDYLASALDVVVQVERGRGGVRRVVEICSVTDDGLRRLGPGDDLAARTRNGGAHGPR